MLFLRRTLCGSTVLAGIMPFKLDDHDKVSKSVKTVSDFANREIVQETGWERIRHMLSKEYVCTCYNVSLFQLMRMFVCSEFGTMTQELNSIYQAGFLGLFFGVCYGGVVHSRDAYTKFMDSNQATAFKSHLDAKKKLQDKVTTGFAKGAFRWGWRVSLFTTSYV